MWSGVVSPIVSVWLPLFPIERLKRERATRKDGSIPDKSVPNDRPFALVGSEERGLALTAVNAACFRTGLTPGLGLADARAICPHLLTAPAAPEKDAEALLALARWSARFTPSLNVDGEDGLWLDVAGISHLFGGSRALLAEMERRLAALGFTARLALAETLGAAHALARFGTGSPIIIPQGKIEAALAPLRVEALRLEPDTTSLLRRLGLKRIGQLYDLPRSSLERRFHSRDAAEAVLLRLDQALGRREEPRSPLLPPLHFLARLPFAEPLITHDGIVAGLKHLAAELCADLTEASRGASRVMLVICRADGSTASIEAGLSAPTREAQHLLRLLLDKIETFDAGFGVDLMVLGARGTEPLLPAQTTLAATSGKAKSGLLIDCLANRLGTRVVRRLFPVQSHLPERAQKMRNVFAGLPSWTGPSPRKPPRPAFLFAKPEPVSVLAEIPEGPPVRFTWRRVTRRVIKSEGPERIAPEWWRELARVSNAPEAFASSEGGESQSRTVSLTPLPNLPHKGGGGASDKHASRPRDYYRIEDEDGCRYWIFREGLYQDNTDGMPAWYLHGVFG